MNLIPQFRTSVISTVRCTRRREAALILTDGNPPKIPGWVPYQEFGTPSFSRPRFPEGNVIGHAGGQDR